ncbi:TRAP transporter small permease subunit [Halomonas piscis]|uniref:TRAP transporter small permease subunit n=1 Tax=Halomonas piscis TaxID=3031727 RepID=UPI00289B4889|nr:TRAP transporter small permease subunit [Halomonas piscis]
MTHAGFFNPIMLILLPISWGFLSIKVGIHVGIDALVNLLPKAIQCRLQRLMALLSAALMAALVWISIGAVADKWQQLMPTIPITAAVFYIPVLLSAGHCCLHLIAQAWQIEPLPSAPAASKEGETL